VSDRAQPLQRPRSLPGLRAGRSPASPPSRHGFPRTLLMQPVLYAVLALLAAWELVVLAHVTPASVLPSPLAVAKEAVHLSRTAYGTKTLPMHALISVRRVAEGFALGSLAGVATGILIKYLRVVRYFVDPFLGFLRPVPAFAFINLLILWFGIGETPKVMLIFLAVYAAMTVFTTAAMDALPREMSDAAATLGARGWRRVVFAELPAALPDVLVGMRVTLALAWTAVMGAELIAASSGLGWMVWNAVRFLQTDVIFVAALSIAVIGALMDLAIVMLTRALTGDWRAHMRGGD
jgi:taurine transport system permease protein